MPARYHEGGTYAMNRNAAKKGKGDINTVYWYTTIVYLVHTSPFSVVVCFFFSPWLFLVQRPWLLDVQLCVLYIAFFLVLLLFASCVRWARLLDAPANISPFFSVVAVMLLLCAVSCSGHGCWMCPVCFFVENSSSSKLCEICTAPNPGTAAVLVPL